MNVGLTELIRAEYETDPNVSIDDLCDRYNVDRHALGPTNDWQKVLEIESNPVVPIQVVEPTKAPTTPSKETASNKDLIDEFKTLTLSEALLRIRSEGADMSIKDMKELVALVDTIDRSYTKSIDANQINIVVQNVIARYVDDC